MFLSFRIFDYNFVGTSYLTMRATCLPHLTPLLFISLITFEWGQLQTMMILSFLFSGAIFYLLIKDCPEHFVFKQVRYPNETVGTITVFGLVFWTEDGNLQVAVTVYDFVNVIPFVTVVIKYFSSAIFPKNMSTVLKLWFFCEFLSRRMRIRSLFPVSVIQLEVVQKPYFLAVSF
jgi:hypothetical protein